MPAGTLQGADVSNERVPQRQVNQWRIDHGRGRVWGQTEEWRVFAGDSAEAPEIGQFVTVQGHGLVECYAATWKHLVTFKLIAAKNNCSQYFVLYVFRTKFTTIYREQKRSLPGKFSSIILLITCGPKSNSMHTTREKFVVSSDDDVVKFTAAMYEYCSAMRYS